MRTPATWSSTTAEPSNANEQAFNIVFNVFIQEMLHLQLAANMATTINVKGAPPEFDSPALMNPKTHAWTCYGPKLTVIPSDNAPWNDQRDAARATSRLR